MMKLHKRVPLCLILVLNATSALATTTLKDVVAPSSGLKAEGQGMTSVKEVPLPDSNNGEEYSNFGDNALITIFGYMPVENLELLARSSARYRKVIKSKEFYDTAMKKRPLYDALRSSLFRVRALLEMSDKTERKKRVLQMLDLETQFVSVPALTYAMGTSDEGGELAPSSEQKHWVHVNRFSMQKTKVSQLLWYLVTSSNPSKFKLSYYCSSKDSVHTLDRVSLCIRNPVERPSWKAVVKGFIPILERDFGIVVRLPSEAEWERAARGRSPEEDEHFNEAYYFGPLGKNNINLLLHGWIVDNSNGQTHPLGEKEEAVNSLGLQEMCGNVSEWVADWFAPYQDAPKKRSPLLNPQGPTDALPSIGSFKVWRSGSALTYGSFCKVSARGLESVERQDPGIGFRTVWVAMTH